VSSFLRVSYILAFFFLLFGRTKEGVEEEEEEDGACLQHSLSHRQVLLPYRIHRLLGYYILSPHSHSLIFYSTTTTTKNKPLLENASGGSQLVIGTTEGLLLRFTVTDAGLSFFRFIGKTSFVICLKVVEVRS